MWWLTESLEEEGDRLRQDEGVVWRVRFPGPVDNDEALQRHPNLRQRGILVWEDNATGGMPQCQEDA